MQFFSASNLQSHIPLLLERFVEKLDQEFWLKILLLKLAEFKTNCFFHFNQYKNNNSDQNDVKVRVWYKRDEIKVFGGFL